MNLCRFCYTINRNKFNLRNSLLKYEVYKPIQSKLNIFSRPNVFVLHRTHRFSCFKETNPLCLRAFHLSNAKRALPPILWVVIRSVLRVAAIITGRGIRKWWARLPNNKRAYIFSKIKENKQKIMVGGALSCGAVYTYYVMHLVEDPITKRKRFLIFSEEQVIQMAMIECEVVMENFKGQIIKSGYHYNRVLGISQRILSANRHLPGTKRNWRVLIVNDDETKNAFVLPSGHIFIFTGMLAVVNNEDQLAAVIGHEMAHALLNHSAEVASQTHLLEMLMLLPLVALWTVFPGSIALFSHYFTEYVTAVLFQLPFSRSLESEADTVGLEMISRACYNPQEASLFWRKMEKFAEDEEVELLSTHPSHQTRYKMLDEFMPKALQIFAGNCTKQYMDSHGRR